MLGVAYVVPPGPVNVETVRLGLSRGAAAVLATQMGSVIVDIVYTVLALVGIRFLLTHTIVQSLLGLTGTVLLGSLLSLLMIAFLVGYWCLRITPQFLRWTSSVCGVALIAFALSLGYSAVLAWPH
jgi:threonine/homoserine/homoserine lactone efflux protein